MGWLDEILGETLKNLKPGMFTDWSFGFADMQSAITLVETAIKRNEVETAEAGRAAALKAAADPGHSYMKNPVFVPMGRELRKASRTLPRLLRSGLFIQIYSQTEFLLLAWCESLSDDAGALSKHLKKRNDKESSIARYLRFLRDDANIALGDFTTWPEWEAIDDGYRAARNALAHRGGVIDEADDQKKIAALPHIMIDTSRLQVSEPIVHLMPGACEAAAATAQAFIGRAIAIAARDARWSGPVPPT